MLGPWILSSTYPLTTMPTSVHCCETADNLNHKHRYNHQLPHLYLMELYCKTTDMILIGISNDSLLF